MSLEATPQTDPTTRRASTGVGRVALIAGAGWLLGLGATIAFAAGGLRTGLLTGLVTGLLGTAIGLVLLEFALRKADPKPTDLLQVQVIGFLGRLLLVGAGLVVVLKAGGDAIGFAIGFFAPFFGVSLLEAVLVTRPRGASPAAVTNGSSTDV